MLSTNRKIRWGILGLGNIARKFITDLLTVEDAMLYAVASRSPLKADEFKAEYDAEIAYSNYEDLAKDPNVDAVYIATPHVCHNKNTLLCLEYGKAVLCEKPLAMNSDEAEAMIATARLKNVLLMEALWTRFLPHYEYVMELLARKEFGKVLKVEADFGSNPEFDPESRLFNKALGGGSLMDIGIYPVFAALSALGTPDTVTARAEYFSTGVDASCTVNFVYNSGATAHLKSTMTRKTPTIATFFCEKGTIRINETFFSPSTVSLITDEGEKTLHFDTATIGYSYEIKHFNQLLQEEKTESPVMSFDFSRSIITTLDQIRAKIELVY